MAVKNASKNLTSSKIKTQKGWEGAVAQAEAKILSLRLRITELQKAIQVFKGNAQSGEPWLTVSQKAGTKRESIPA